MARIGEVVGATLVVGTVVAAGCAFDNSALDSVFGGNGSNIYDGDGLGSSGGFGSSGGDPSDPDNGKKKCVGLQCHQAPYVPACPGGGTTTLTGKVYDPSGTVPLYNAIVYVPNEALTRFEGGVTCDQCGTVPSGKPVATALTDATGSFTLENVPIDVSFPLVVQIGRWRRVVEIKPEETHVETCGSTELNAGLTRLPRDKSEGELPKIAITTGGWDSLECLFRRLGIDDSEFTNPDGNGSVHLYRGADYRRAADGYERFASWIDGNTPSATTLWNDLETLKKYDMVILSCEGSENNDTKSEGARANLKNYLDLGGRVFASHYHYTWFKNSPSLSTIATWKDADPDGHGADLDVLVDTTVPKGEAFRDWLVTVEASTVPGHVPMVDVKSNVASVSAESRLWLYAGDKGGSTTSSNTMGPKYFSFNTPLGVKAEEQCGRGVYTDIHVSTPDTPTGNDDVTGVPFPTGCSEKTSLSAQEKALLFLMMDLASCIQNDVEIPKPPLVK